MYNKIKQYKLVLLCTILCTTRKGLDEFIMSRAATAPWEKKKKKKKNHAKKRRRRYLLSVSPFVQNWEMFIMQT